MPVGSTVSTLLFGVVIVAALYIGRDVFVPIALAILLSFVLAPLVRFLQSWRVPRGVSVVLVVIVSFVAILGIGGVMVAQMNQLAEDLPRYQSTLREKIQSLRGVTGGGTLDKAADVLMDLGKELDTPKSGAKAGSQRAPSQAAERPVPVEIRQPDPGALQTVVTLITPLVHPRATSSLQPRSVSRWSGHLYWTAPHPICCSGIAATLSGSAIRPTDSPSEKTS